MAHYRRHHRKHRTHHRRHHRMAGIGATKDVVMKVAGIAAGVAAGALVVSAVRKNFATAPKMVAPLAPLVLGLFLPRFVKSDLGAAAGAGMIAAGSAFLLSSTVLPLPGITGIGYIRPYGQLRSQKSVGAPGFSNKPIGAMHDSAVIGALSEN